jgi:hypothetical protein
MAREGAMARSRSEWLRRQRTRHLLDTTAEVVRMEIELGIFSWTPEEKDAFYGPHYCTPDEKLARLYQQARELQERNASGAVALGA